jgi:hypothetical protein
MRTIAVVLSLAFGVIGVGAAGWVYSMAPPKTEVLDKDIQEVRASIKGAEVEASRYEGGLIKVQIEGRIAVLKNTEAMLLQKRASVLRFVNLNFTAKAGDSPVNGEAELARIQKDIDATSIEIRKANEEAAQYSGGLILSLILARRAQYDLNLAILQGQYLSTKYGVPIMQSEASARDKVRPKSILPGKPAADKDALK